MKTWLVALIAICVAIVAAIEYSALQDDNLQTRIADLAREPESCRRAESDLRQYESGMTPEADAETWPITERIVQACKANQLLPRIEISLQ